MKRLIPIHLDNDSGRVHDALCRLLVRTAQLARKRPSPLDTAIGPAAIDIIVAIEGYVSETLPIETAIKRLDETLT
jgi:hypothetical protein